MNTELHKHFYLFGAALRINCMQHCYSEGYFHNLYALNQAEKCCTIKKKDFDANGSRICFYLWRLIQISSGLPVTCPLNFQSVSWKQADVLVFLAVVPTSPLTHVQLEDQSLITHNYALLWCFAYREHIILFCITVYLSLKRNYCVFFVFMEITWLL